MTSGIYRLTFSSGKYYVGKSLDIDTRWKQHFNKFATGKAARPMQLEYDRCGLPKTEVIFECHRDHIDILEEWLIDQLKGPDMLNTTYPDIKRDEETAQLINNNHERLQQSTWQHLKIMQVQQELADQAVSELELAVRKTEAYRDKGYLIDDDYKELQARLQGVEHDLNCTLDENTRLQLRLQRAQKLGLWDRIFNYTV